MKICPDILEELSSQVREKIFVVCGTNGKTTTNNMLCAGLEAEGKKVICNHTGSNMLNGVVAAFVLGAKFSGKLDPQTIPTTIKNSKFKIKQGIDKEIITRILAPIVLTRPNFIAEQHSSNPTEESILPNS